MIGRRTALGLLGAATAIGSGAARAAGAASVSNFDFDRPENRLRAYMLMRGALDDRLVIGWVSGDYFGVVDAVMTPLFGVVAATFSRYRPRPGGGYDAATVETAYFTDLATGRALDAYVNPYTGESVTIPVGGMAPARFSILPDLSLKLGRELKGMSFVHDIRAPQQRGEDVWITELTKTASAPPGATKPFNYSEMTILHARARDLDQRGAKRVACEISFTNVVNWRPWLRMGDRPGHMTSIGAGRYGATLDMLPPAWLEATRARRPELLKDPGAVLAPLWEAGR